MEIDPRLALYALDFNQLINDKKGQMFAVFIEFRLQVYNASQLCKKYDRNFLSCESVHLLLITCCVFVQVSLTLLITGHRRASGSGCLI